MNVLALALGAVAVAHGAAALSEDMVRARTVQPARGAGRIVGGPLVYRDLRGRVAAKNGYLVLFRTAGTFAAKNDSGSITPGQLLLADTFDNHDGFNYIRGVQRHCYSWMLYPTPVLRRLAPGTRIPLRFDLRFTARQIPTVRLRAIPRHLPRFREIGNADSHFVRGPIARDLTRIGCRPRY